jgi:hypothetical protein
MGFKFLTTPEPMAPHLRWGEQVEVELEAQRLVLVGAQEERMQPWARPVGYTVWAEEAAMEGAPAEEVRALGGRLELLGLAVEAPVRGALGAKGLVARQGTLEGPVAFLGWTLARARVGVLEASAGQEV